MTLLSSRHWYLAEIRDIGEGRVEPHDFMGYAPRHVIEKLMKSTSSQLNGDGLSGSE